MSAICKANMTKWGLRGYYTNTGDFDLHSQSHDAALIFNLFENIT